MALRKRACTRSAEGLSCAPALASTLPGGLCGMGFRPEGDWETGPRKAVCQTAWLRGCQNCLGGPDPRLDLTDDTPLQGPAWPKPGMGSAQPQQRRESPAGPNVSGGLGDPITRPKGAEPLPSSHPNHEAFCPPDTVGIGAWGALGLWP